MAEGYKVWNQAEERVLTHPFVDLLWFSSLDVNIAHKVLWTRLIRCVHGVQGANVVRFDFSPLRRSSDSGPRPGSGI